MSNELQRPGDAVLSSCTLLEGTAPLWENRDGAPVFLTPERRGFCRATGRATGCGDEPFEICMESTTLHAYFEVRVHSSCR